MNTHREVILKIIYNSLIASGQESVISEEFWLGEKYYVEVILCGFSSSAIDTNKPKKKGKRRVLFSELIHFKAILSIWIYKHIFYNLNLLKYTH